MAHPLKHGYHSGGGGCRQLVQAIGQDLDGLSVYDVKPGPRAQGVVQILGKTHEITTVAAQVATNDVIGCLLDPNDVGHNGGLDGSERKRPQLALDCGDERAGVHDVHAHARQTQSVYRELVLVSELQSKGIPSLIGCGSSWSSVKR